MSFPPPATDYVGSKFKLVKHGRYVGGIVLAVAVKGHDDWGLRCVYSNRYCITLAKILF